MIVNIVGQQFRDPEAQSLLHSLPAGGIVALVREAENPYDSNAVGVWALGKGPIQVGYIKRQQAAEIGPEMDQRGLRLVQAKLSLPGENILEFVWPTWDLVDEDGLVCTSFDHHEDAVRFGACRPELRLLDPNQEAAKCQT